MRLQVLVTQHDGPTQYTLTFGNKVCKSKACFIGRELCSDTSSTIRIPWSHVEVTSLSALSSPEQLAYASGYVRARASRDPTPRRRKKMVPSVPGIRQEWTQAQKGNWSAMCLRMEKVISTFLYIKYTSILCGHCGLRALFSDTCFECTEDGSQQMRYEFQSCTCCIGSLK